MPKVSELIAQLVPVVEALATNPNRTPGEDENLQTLTEVSAQYLQNFKGMKAIMGASLSSPRIIVHAQ